MIFDTFQCKTNPFAENLAHEDIHRDARFTTALEQIKLFPELGDISLLSARSGLGKSIILQDLMVDWKTIFDVHYLHLGSLNGSGLFRSIVNKLGERPRLGKDRMFAQIFAQLAKRSRPQCFLLDEAQLMDIPTMTDLRLLCGDPEVAGRLKLLLSGQPSLEKNLQAESLTDLRERLCLKVQLRPLSMVESIDYMDHRLKRAGSRVIIFEEDALQLVVNAAKGVPRKINGLAFRSMLSAVHKKIPKIDANTVREVYASEMP